FIKHSLFRPFRSTKKKGLGIGMFQSKTIVEAHQGNIHVESELGVRTTFRVMLPLKCQTASNRNYSLWMTMKPYGLRLNGHWASNTKSIAPKTARQRLKAV